MKPSTFLLLIGAAVAVYFIGQSGQKKPAMQTAGGSEEPANPVLPLIEQTLAQHAGEDSAIVHAFEEAVAHEHPAGS